MTISGKHWLKLKVVVYNPLFSLPVKVSVTMDHGITIDPAKGKQINAIKIIENHSFSEVETIGSKIKIAA